MHHKASDSVAILDKLKSGKYERGREENWKNRCLYFPNWMNVDEFGRNQKINPLFSAVYFFGRADADEF